MQKICTRKEVVDMFYKKMGINKKIIKKNLISPQLSTIIKSQNLTKSIKNKNASML